MRIDKQINKHNSRLLLFFAGWSASPELFRNLTTEEDMDVWICYDYRDLAFDANLTGYKEIYLIAWSLGVWVAATVFENNRTLPRPTTAIAINGTCCPIDDTRGIPEAIFRGTLAHVTEEGMHRFNRRMCGNREILRQYEQTLPRPLHEMQEELQHLYQKYQEVESNGWTHAILASADRIFPAENLRNYWLGRCPVTEIEAPHYPFYHWKKWNEIWKQ